MSTFDQHVGLNRAAAGAKQFRSGIARTLGRRALPSQLQPQGMPTPFVPGGGIASPHAFPLHHGDTRPQEPVDPVSPGPPSPAQRATVTAGGNGGAIRRSQTQMAAFLARAVAQGQRNL